MNINVRCSVCEDCANEREESLLSTDRVRFFLCKDNKNIKSYNRFAFNFWKVDSVSMSSGHFPAQLRDTFPPLWMDIPMRIASPSDRDVKWAF